MITANREQRVKQTKEQMRRLRTAAEICGKIEAPEMLRFDYLKSKPKRRSGGARAWGMKFESGESEAAFAERMQAWEERKFNLDVLAAAYGRDALDDARVLNAFRRGGLGSDPDDRDTWAAKRQRKAIKAGPWGGGRELLQTRKGRAAYLHGRFGIADLLDRRKYYPAEPYQPLKDAVPSYALSQTLRGSAALRSIRLWALARELVPDMREGTSPGGFKWGNVMLTERAAAKYLEYLYMDRRHTPRCQLHTWTVLDKWSHDDVVLSYCKGSSYCKKNRGFEMFFPGESTVPNRHVAVPNLAACSKTWAVVRVGDSMYVLRAGPEQHFVGTGDWDDLVNATGLIYLVRNGVTVPFVPSEIRTYMGDGMQVVHRERLRTNVWMPPCGIAGSAVNTVWRAAESFGLCQTEMILLGVLNPTSPKVGIDSLDPCKPDVDFLTLEEWYRAAAEKHRADITLKKDPLVPPEMLVPNREA